MRTSTCVTMLWRVRVVHRSLWLLLRRLAVKIGNTIGVCRSALRLIVVAFEVVWVSVLAASRLRDIWDDLHSAWYNTSRSSTTSSIS